VLLVDVKELRNRHTHLVRAPDQVSFVAGFLILNSFSLLVVADSLVNWVWDLGKGFLAFIEDEFFLLDFDLVSFVDRLILKNDRPHQQRHYEAFDGVLLFVLHLHSDVGAVFYLVVRELGVCAELVPVDRPEVAEHKHSIYCNRQNKAHRGKQVLLVEHAEAKDGEYDGPHNGYEDSVNPR